MTKLGSPEEFHAKFESMTAEVFSKPRERMEEFLETFDRTSKQTIDLYGKTLGIYQATSVTDAQRRAHDSSLAALRGNPLRSGSVAKSIGYARVSKVDAQDTAVQVKALRHAGCKRIFEEKASGGRWDRPELHRALEQLREGDVLVVWKLDRAFAVLERFAAHHGTGPRSRR